MWTAYEVLSDKEKRRQYDQFGDGLFDGSARSADFHDMFSSHSFFNDDDMFFNRRRSAHFPRDSAFHFQNAFNGFEMPGFDFDSFHRRHHENAHRSAHQRGGAHFNQQHHNMHRAAHDATHRQRTSFHQQSSGRSQLVSYLEMVSLLDRITLQDALWSVSVGHGCELC